MAIIRGKGFAPGYDHHFFLFDINLFSACTQFIRKNFEIQEWRRHLTISIFIIHPRRLCLPQARDTFVGDSLGKLSLTSNAEAALATADLVVEAITENLPLKQEPADHMLTGVVVIAWTICYLYYLFM